MEEKDRQALKSVLSVLDDLIMGKSFGQVENEAQDELIHELIEKLNKLTLDLHESNEVALDIAEGKLDGIIPGRRNYFGAPLKRLQSRLSILTWNIEQLQKGKVVSKIEFEGEMYDAFNGLIDKVAEMSLSSGDLETAGENEGKNISSWRFHQILLALNNINMMVLEVNTKGDIVYANRQAKEMLDGVTSLSSVQPVEHGGNLVSKLAHLSQEGQDFPVRTEFSDESCTLWYSIVSERVVLPNGQVFFLHVVDDITAWKMQAEKLEQKAATDVMTGTLNKRGGLDMMHRYFLESPEGIESSLVFIDLDNLKQVNDTFGHPEGDVYIKFIASTLLGGARRSDFVIRYGGDEFLLFLHGCSQDIAEKRVLELCEKVEQAQRETKRPYEMGFSYGIVSFLSSHDADMFEIIDAADRKMYQNKKEKKGGRGAAAGMQG